MEGSNGYADWSSAQRALLAMDLMRSGVKVDDARARAHAGSKAIEKVRGVLRRRPDLEAGLRDGTLSLNAAMTEAGFHAKGSDIPLGHAFGKGDKWMEATEPLVRYLTGWRVRGMEFKHLNPREAQKRLDRIEILEGMLGEMKADLAGRAVRAQTSVRSN